MKTKKLIPLLAALTLLTTLAAADDYIIRDNNGNPLFTVNGSGEKQIQNGNLYLNGNSIVDNEGSLTLDGGDVEIPAGNLNLSDNSIENVQNISFRAVGESENNDVPVIAREPGTNTLKLYTSGGGGTDNQITIVGRQDGEDIARFIEGSENVQLPNGNLQMNGNEIQNVGALELGWNNLTDYPTGCETDEAVQVIGDTLTCTSLNPGGTVETGGGAAGQVSFFIDSENITGSDNFYWDNSNTELGLGTNTPTARLDVNGQTNLRNTLRMNSNDIQNPANVDGVNLDNPGNAISVNNNQYQVDSSSIESSELGANAVTSSGGELDSSVAGNQLGLNSGTLDVQDRWVDENGDTIRNQLTFDVSGNDFFKLQDASGGSNNAAYTLRFDTPRNFRIWSNQTGTGTVLRAKHNGNVAIESGNLQLGGNSITTTGNVGGVNLDNPGNGITLSGNQYQISSGAIDSNEIAENSVTNNELDNSDSFNMNGLTVEGDTQIQGNLDVWGNIQNTNVTNLNVDGSILPPSGYDATFNIGSSSRRWQNAYFSGTGQFDSGLTVSGGAVDIPSGTIQNSELENSAITVNANSGLSGGGTPSLGGSTGLSHADTSSVNNAANSDGTVLQDMTFDGYGHVESRTSTNLDTRYYTETESDDNFVDTSGDSMSGNLEIATSGEEEITLGTGNHAEHYIRMRNDNGFGSTIGYDPSVGDNGGTRIQSGDGKDIVLAVNNGTFGEGQVGLKIDQNADLNVPNSINNFFGSNCASGEVVESVNADGTYNCQSITGAADDTYVNEGGDTMTDALDMSGNNIENVGNLNASNIELNGDGITSLFVDEEGDSMSGPLNMGGNDVNNVNTLDFNSVGNIQTDGTNAVNIDGNQNVEVPNGDIQMNSNSVTGQNGYIGYDGSNMDIAASSGYVVAQTSGSGASGFSVWDDANSQTVFSADEGGNVEIPNGQLQMNSHKITGVSNPDNAGDAANKDYVDTQIDETDPTVETFDSADGSVNVDPLQTLQVDEGAGFRLTDQGNGVARLSMGSHWKTLYIDGSQALTPDGQEPLNFATGNDLSISSNSGSSPQTLTFDVDDSFVRNNGDTMTDDLNMDYNAVNDVGELNVSTSDSQVAHFSDTGIEFDQPLSLDSSGPLSVSNGVDLTGTSSNTIESYSTMYLSTSSGSPSDIVLDPTGSVGIDANASITGDLDMQGGAITNVDWANTDQGSGSGLDADTLDGVELSNINWADTAISQSDVSPNDVGLAALSTDSSLSGSNYDGTTSRTWGVAWDDANDLDNNGNLDPSSNVNMNQNNLTNLGGGSASIDGGDIQFQPISAGGTAGLSFQSNGNAGSDGGWLTWYDDNDNYNYWGDTSENGALVLGTANDGQGTNSDVTVLKSPAAAVIDSPELYMDGATLNMNGNVINNVGSPSDSNDAVPRSYVDSAQGTATQTLNEVLNEGSDAGSQSITDIGSGNIDIDNSGNGNLNLNSNDLRGGSIAQSSNLVAGSYSTGSGEVDGGDAWIQNDVQVGGDIVGSGADVAEKINNESEMEPGTVVSISGNMSVDRTTGKHDTDVAGVVSSDPAMVMAESRDGVPIAMTGTVPVKVTMENGKIMPGDMLTTSSTSGKAMKCGDMSECEGSIIGKAMQPASKPGEVKMLISMS